MDDELKKGRVFFFLRRLRLRSREGRTANDSDARSVFFAFLLLSSSSSSSIISLFSLSLLFLSVLTWKRPVRVDSSAGAGPSAEEGSVETPERVGV